MARAREVFEASEDFTVGTRGGVRDPRSRARWTWPSASGSCATRPQADEVLAEAVAGELIESEIEIRSGRGDDLRRRRGAPARGARPPVRARPPATGALLSATGTHPWSPWQEQRIIDTEHYRRVEDGLKYVAWRNNTFSLHVHVGVRGADRAIAVCDRLRPVLPELLALSANSPVPGRPRLRACTRRAARSSPRAFRAAGSRTRSAASAAYADYVDFLVRTELDRRAHPAVVERAAPSLASARSSSGSATPSPAPRSRPRWRG